MPQGKLEKRTLRITGPCLRIPGQHGSNERLCGGFVQRASVLGAFARLWCGLLCVGCRSRSGCHVRYTFAVFALDMRYIISGERLGRREKFLTSKPPRARVRWKEAKILRLLSSMNVSM